jgi:hypothetical protein
MSPPDTLLLAVLRLRNAAQRADIPLPSVGATVSRPPTIATSQIGVVGVSGGRLVGRSRRGDKREWLERGKGVVNSCLPNWAN